MQEITGGTVQWRDEHLTPVSNRSLLARMLRNLKVIYLQRREYDHALPVLDLLVALLPEDQSEQQDHQALIRQLKGWTGHSPSR